MELDLQAQAGTCGEINAPCPDATTPERVNMQIDWVAAYAYRPAPRASASTRTNGGTIDP
jgi:hypothetical protein